MTTSGLERLCVCFTTLFALASQHPVGATNLFVAPNGSPAGNGSLQRPVDLVTALSGNFPVQPGDTLWLRGGTYAGNFTSVLTGTALAPIVVRQFPGERATIDGSLTVNGTWTYYIGFEVTNSNPDRTQPRPDGVDVFGPGTKLIDLIIHDAGQGVGFWTPAVNAEVYGCLIYNNGLIQNGIRDGHGIYTQNATGVKHITDNVIFDQYGYGIHAYGEQGQLNNFCFDGNVSFNNGGTPMLVGGTHYPSQNVMVTNNYIYNGAMELGYVATGNENLLLSGNYIGKGDLEIKFWDHVTATNNTICQINSTGIDNGMCVGPDLIDYVAPANVALPSYNWANNTYIDYKLTPFATDGVAPFWLTLAQWQQRIGSDQTSVLKVQQPAGQAVFVRPDHYLPGRAHIIVYNWSHVPTISVNLRGILQSGERYEVRDAQNFYGNPVIGATSSTNPVTLPLTGTATGPEFNVFVVVPVGANGAL